MTSEMVLEIEILYALKIIRLDGDSCNINKDRIILRNANISTIITMIATCFNTVIIICSRNKTNSHDNADIVKLVIIK